MSSLTVGLIGCGLWGRNVLRDLLREGAEVVVADPVARARRAARAEGASHVVPDVAGLPALDGVVVATPASTHARVIEEVLPRDVPVFAEKPLTTDTASAERLARAAPGRLFVMHVFRYHAGVETLASLARGGELGPLVSLSSTRAHWGSPRTDVDSVWTLAPHDLSIAIAVLGGLPAARGAVAETADRQVTGMTAVLGEEPSFTLGVSSRRRPRRREVSVHGRDGSARLDCDGDTVELWRGEASVPELRRFSPEPSPLRREVRSFLEHLRGGGPPPTGADEGALVVRRLEELRRLAGLDR